MMMRALRLSGLVTQVDPPAAPWANVPLVEGERDAGQRVHAVTLSLSFSLPPYFYLGKKKKLMGSVYSWSLE